MNKDQIRDAVNRTFYSSLEESGTEVNALPPGQLQAIVRAVADSIYAVMEGLEEETPPTGPLPTTQDEEEILWTGKPIMTLGERYELTSQRLRIYRGVFSRNLEEIDLVRVRDTKVKQNMGERMAGVGDVTVISTDKSNPEIVLNNVKDPVTVRETIRKAYLAEQDRRGLRFREE
ncbi:MAG: PH domain-containing protein [Vulcanimicrobiota bacterium]